MGKSAGPAPDYKGAAQNDFQQGMQANRPNQSTAFGSTTWDGGGMHSGLSPELQGAMSGMVAQLRGGAGGGASADAAYKQATSRLDPQWQQRESAFGSQMAAQGLDPRDDAYKGAAGTFNNARNDAYGGARADAFGQGLQAFNSNMNGLGGLYSFMQGPSFHGVQGPNTLGAAQADGAFRVQDAANQNQLWGDAVGGLFGLGGSALGGWMGKK